MSRKGDIVLTINVEGAMELSAALADEGSVTRIHQDALVEAVDLLVRTAKSKAPVKTGKLQKSIRGVVNGPKNYGVVQPYAKHAMFAELGTKRHLIMAGKKTYKRKRLMINAKVKKALRLPDGSYRAWVMHPGATKHAFLWPTVDATRSQVEAILSKAGEGYVIRVSRAAIKVSK